MIATINHGLGQISASRMSNQSRETPADTAEYPNDTQSQEQIFFVLRQATDEGLRSLAQFLDSQPGRVLSSRAQLDVHKLIVRIGVRALDAALRMRSDTMETIPD